MKDVFSWIVAHWQLLFLALLFLISTILQLVIKKKPISDITSFIFELALEAVLIAESSSFVKGEEKLSIAVQYVLSKLKIYYPSINVENYRAGVITIIEDILSTPQKHEKDER